MTRALQLAAMGRGHVSPNPMVGCVIVHEDSIIGEGYHEQFGGPHAEVHALQSVHDESLLPKSTVYVTLEPCSHHGKTPPCADLLVKKQVKKVVIAVSDPNPQVNGSGITRMRDAGIEVVTGVLKEKSEALNIRFNTYHRKKRPYVILKWAQTADGFIARANYDSKWISNPQSRQLVHKWRTEEDAILVGTQTALHDDPALTARDWVGRNPTRIVIDRSLRLPGHLQLFDGAVPTLVFNTKKQETQPNLEWIKLSGENTVTEILEQLHQRTIASLLVEGGRATLQQFLKTGLWDEARVFINPVTFAKGIKAPLITAAPKETVQILNDTLHYYFPL